MGAETEFPVCTVTTAPETQREPSRMDNLGLLGDNFAHTMRQAPHPRRLNEFDPEYAR
jgi:hypothetical protein